MVDAEHHRGIDIFSSGCGNDDLLRAALEMRGRFFLGREQSRAFHDHVDAERCPRQLGRVALGENLDAVAADAPKTSMPTPAPCRSSAAPTYLCQKSLTPASTAILGKARGRTLSRHTASWRSKRLVHGMATTRTGIPVSASAFCAPSASATSEPVAMMTTFGLTESEST